ncbi:MAG: hypothetical protein AAGA22_08595, partial [Pseudomonadota bacterium]
MKSDAAQPKSEDQKLERKSGSSAAKSDARIIDRLNDMWVSAPIYRSQIDGPVPDRFLCQLSDPWPADNARSRFVETKAITLGDERLSFQREANELFDLAEPNTKVFDYLHGWRWLRDLTANDSRNADTARALA